MSRLQKKTGGKNDERLQNTKRGTFTGKVRRTISGHLPG